jgi:hypothetical protein
MGIAEWRKSSASGGVGNECVEVRLGSDAVLVRDSKGRPELTLRFGPASWLAFRDVADSLNDPR